MSEFVVEIDDEDVLAEGESEDEFEDETPEVEPDFDFEGETNPRTVVAEFKALKLRRDAARDEFKHLDGQLKRAKAIVNERMRDPDDIGMDTIKIKGTGRFVAPEPTWYAQVQDRRAFQMWARENRPGLLRTTEERKLLNSLVRERLASHQELPPGLGAYPRRTVSVYKA